LAPGNDIEDRFANAVKLALEAHRSVGPSSETPADPAQMRGRRRAHPWLIALLYTALTATVAIIVVAALLG